MPDTQTLSRLELAGDPVMVDLVQREPRGAMDFTYEVQA